MVFALRDIIKKLYNFTEGQDTHKLPYKEVMSAKVIIKGENAGQNQRCMEMFYTAFPALNYTLLRRRAEWVWGGFVFGLGMHRVEDYLSWCCLPLVHLRLHSQCFIALSWGRGVKNTSSIWRKLHRGSTLDDLLFRVCIFTTLYKFGFGIRSLNNSPR